MAALAGGHKRRKHSFCLALIHSERGARLEYLRTDSRGQLMGAGIGISGCNYIKVSQYFPFFVNLFLGLQRSGF